MMWLGVVVILLLIVAIFIGVLIYYNVEWSTWEPRYLTKSSSLPGTIDSPVVTDGDIISVPESSNKRIVQPIKKVITDLKVSPFGTPRKGMWVKGRYIEHTRQNKACNCLEYMYGIPFESDVRPDINKNPETGRNLEFDCYNKDFGMALEFQGQQHYTFPHRFGGNEKQFQYDLKKDLYKKQNCQLHGIYLIELFGEEYSDQEIIDAIWDALPENQCTSTPNTPVYRSRIKEL